MAHRARVYNKHLKIWFELQGMIIVVGAFVSEFESNSDDLICAYVTLSGDVSSSDGQSLATYLLICDIRRKLLQEQVLPLYL